LIGLSLQSEQQQENEEAICALIHSLVENTYDEFGELVIQEDFDIHYWKSGTEYIKLVQKASAGQIVMLTFSILLCLGLLGYSCFLHKKLVYRRPWMPPNHVGSYYGGGMLEMPHAVSEAGRLSRLNSGIVAMRSASVEEASQTGGQVEEDTLSPARKTKPYMYL